MTEPKVELFLDSGAFSAWTKGVVIDLDEYADFILANKGAFAVVANLDVIPGGPGRTPSSAEIEAAAEAGWENWKVLTKKLQPAGIVPLHTYHRGEDIKWLRRLMDHAEYFGIGGLALPGMRNSDRRAYLNDIMPVLTDDDGWPIRQFHGFGLTSVDIMLEFPFASVDSTSWVLQGRFGGCYLWLDGRVLKVTFSNQSPKQSEAGQHFTTYSQVEQRAITRHVEAMGFTVAELADDYVARDRANITFFLELEKRWVTRPWKRREAQKAFSL